MNCMCVCCRRDAAAYEHSVTLSTYVHFHAIRRSEIRKSPLACISSCSSLARRRFWEPSGPDTMLAGFDLVCLWGACELCRRFRF
mmetsp:Transcript_9584/g.16746  ORF Transcript_9584/g.16746 Transcript_9584/m.16746 type:complete len:85 (-) Transcript_9584:512-766(-)